MLKYLVVVGALAQIIAVLLYIKDMFKGSTKPNRVSWLMWSIPPLIGAAISFSDGAGFSVLPVFAAGLGGLMVFIASFLIKKSYWHLNVFDYVCGFFSFLAIIFWLITSQAETAIIFAIVADVFASIPTLVKLWRYPESETAVEYASAIFICSTSFFAITAWTFTAYAFPAYLVLINIALTFCIYRKKLKFI